MLVRALVLKQIQVAQGATTSVRLQRSMPPPGGSQGNDSSSSSSDQEDEEEVAAPPDWMTDEDSTARCMVFLVTFAAVLAATALQSDTPLRVLDGMTRAAILAAILDAVENPVPEDNPRGGRPRTRKLEAEVATVFLETPLHFHVVLKLNCITRFLPFKLALRHRSGLASHWSTSHSQLWSALRYGVWTTEHKTAVDREPLVWAKRFGILQPVAPSPHLPNQKFASEDGAFTFDLYEKSQEPWNAAALKRRREASEAAAVGEAATKDKKVQVAKFNLLDFTALVVEKELLTPNAVLAYAQECGSHALQLYVRRNQKKLADLIEDSIAWRDAKRNLSIEMESDWELVQRLAKGKCSCQGSCHWRAAANDFCVRNQATIDHQQLAAALVKIMQNGPSKTTRVPMIVGPTNAAKSLMIDPVNNVFGRDKVAQTPALGASMPLASLVAPGKRFLYWDEFSPTEFASRPRSRPTVPAVTFKKLLGGQLMEVQVSQSFSNGNPWFRWQRGAALTAPLADLWKEDPPVTAEDIRHMQSRVDLYQALVPIQGPLRDTPHCPESWCAWVVEESTQFAARSAPHAMPVRPSSPEDDEWHYL